jgi:hypothetical protein
MLFDLLRPLFGVILIISLAMVLAFPLGERISAQEDCDADCHQLLGAVRAATAKYQRESVALADGYVADPVCVSSPAGGMGTHYVNVALVQEPGVDPLRPEVLLYATMKNGKRKLIGVEYLAPLIVTGVGPWYNYMGTPTPGTYDPAPTLFGQTFDGPMAGHNPFMPWHYDQHVWIWQHNPDGMFAQFNPTVECP